MTFIRHLAALFCALTLATTAMAQDVRITTFKQDVTFSTNGRTISITRDQNTAAVLSGEFARTSRACPPDCIQPMSAADGVATFGELETLAFLENNVADGTGLLLDVRAATDFAASSIPSAVNVPYATLDETNRFRNDILRALGAVDGPSDSLDFSNAMSLLVFSGGVWSADAAHAINYLLAAGYPADKLFYFRGGLQAWLHVGLTVQ